MSFPSAVGYASAGAGGACEPYVAACNADGEVVEPPADEATCSDVSKLRTAFSYARSREPSSQLASTILFIVLQYHVPRTTYRV